jgi:hypothetical protein
LHALREREQFSRCEVDLSLLQWPWQQGRRSANPFCPALALSHLRVHRVGQACRRSAMALPKRGRWPPPQDLASERRWQESCLSSGTHRSLRVSAVTLADALTEKPRHAIAHAETLARRMLRRERERTLYNAAGFSALSVAYTVPPLKDPPLSYWRHQIRRKMSCCTRGQEV